MGLSTFARRAVAGVATRPNVLHMALRAHASKPAPAYKFEELTSVNHMNVPRLPVPPLADTLKRYLFSVEPLLTADEFAKHKAEVAEFEAGAGPALQAKLLAEDQHEGYPHSYIEKHWDDMYLGLRCPQPVFVSPFFKLADDPDTSKSHLRRAAEFTTSFVKWTRKILDGTFEPDLVGKGPATQCSSSFAPMFASSKTPRQGRDEIEQYPQSKTVTVVSKGNTYAVNVISDEGKLISVAALEKQFAAIEAEAAAPLSINVLTTDDRDKWAATRAEMMKDPTNQASLLKLDAGILAVCLDDAMPSLQALSQAALHGDAANRWYDKQQLIAFKDGQMAMNFEHSYSDGLGWARFIHEVMCDVYGKQELLPPNYNPLPAMEVVDAPLGMEKLSFNLTDGTKAAIASSQAAYAELQASVDTCVMDFDHFGKGEIKTWKTAPDAAVQMAYQVAYYKLHKKMPGVYESCATRKFHHGRTETIRSLTPDSHALARCLVDGEAGDKLALLQKAAATHSQVSKDASNGLGCDRHLLVLNYIANRDAPDAIPAFMQNPAYAASKNWLMSTSNASSTPFIDLFGFGAVSMDGYGCGYLIFDDKLRVNVTSYNGDYASKSSAEMKAAIEETLLEFKAIAAAAK